MMRLLKAVLGVVLFFVVLPVLVWFHTLSRVAPGRRDQILQGTSQLLALAPGAFGSHLRVAYYRHVFPSLGEGVHIGFGTIFATPDVTIADRVYIGPFCNLGHVDFGADVLLGSNVTVLSGNRQHLFDRTDVPINQQGGEYRRVAIGTDSWLGNGSVVMASIGPHAIVAAGCVVHKEVAAGDIVGGNPAKVIRNRLGAGDPSSDD